MAKRVTAGVFEACLCVVPVCDHGLALLRGYRGTAEVTRAYCHPIALSRLLTTGTTGEVDLYASVDPDFSAGEDIHRATRIR